MLVNEDLKICIVLKFGAKGKFYEYLVVLMLSSCIGLLANWQVFFGWISNLDVQFSWLNLDYFTYSLCIACSLNVYICVVRIWVLMLDMGTCSSIRLA